MDYKFQYKFVHQAPRKIRQLTNLVKNMDPVDALTQLRFLPRRAAKPVSELIKSGITALSKKNIKTEDAVIKSLTCDGGPMLKRRHYRSRGRADMIRKRMSHITLILTDKHKSEARNSKSKTNSKSKNNKIQNKK